MERTEDRAREEALKYLGARDRTEAEVRRHLKGKDCSEEEIREALDYLREFRYVDDRRYCRAFAEWSAGKGRGPQRVRRELEEKGADPELIREALEEAYGEEQESLLALEAARAALGADGPATEKDLARAGRRLAARGFSAAVIYRTLGRLRREQGEGFEEGEEPQE
ncbi:MAG: regulatory protein RecX [Bacillota bacterium]|nr:regulatory protein RecX [Bacillota bacterium]